MSPEKEIKVKDLKAKFYDRLKELESAQSSFNEVRDELNKEVESESSQEA